MEQFEERLARLNELSDDELAALEQEMVAAFEAADSAGDVETMQAIADALDTVRDARSNKTAPATEQPVAASAAPDENGENSTEEDAPSDDGEEAEVPTPDNESTEPEVPAEETPEVEAPEASTEEATPAEETTEESATEPEAAEASAEEAPESVPAEEAPAAEEPATETEEEPVPVPASAATDTEEAPASETTEEAPTASDEAVTEESESEESVDTNLTAEDVPEDNQPTPAVPAVTIRAGGDIPGTTAGSSLPDMDAVVQALTDKVNSLRHTRGDGQKIVVASMSVEEDPPEERVLRAGDAAGNSRKIRELLSDRDLVSSQEALTAAAWCAPRAPIYDVPTIGTTARPVANALPTFTADRGGITWMQPPGIGVGGVGLWRHNGSVWQSFDNPDASDSAATTKPCATVVCGTEQNIDVDAVTLCLCFDNMSARAFPEWIRANTDLVMVQQARFAEQVLLSRMFSVATTGTTGTPGTQVGAARDFFITVRVAAANFRWERRLGRDASLQLLAPSWVAEAMAADLDLQQPGDNTLGTSLGEVTALFNEINVNPIWFIDDIPGTAFTTGQFTAANTFATYAHWLLYPTGSFVRLDSGELNIGVVRDMNQVQANTYCEFSETFETVAYMGPADPYKWVQRGLTPIDLAGSSGAPRQITIS